MHAATGLANIARIGALVGDPVRASIIATLMDGSERAAGELASRAGASPQAASPHLALLLDGGLLTVTVKGRHRYYRLRDGDVAHAIETLSVAADIARQKTRRLDAHLRRARRCYDHIAGQLGVAICDQLIVHGRIIAGGEGFTISPSGYDWLADLKLAPPRALRRALVRPCLDWTEGRPHLAGWLGAALCQRLEGAGSLRRNAEDRTLHMTPRGRRLLSEYFDLDWV